MTFVPRLPSSSPQGVQHSSSWYIFRESGKIHNNNLKKITFINSWLSYLCRSRPIRHRGISGCLHSLRGVTTLLIHLLCLTKTSPCFCCISRRVSGCIRCLPMDHARSSKLLQEAISLSLSGLPSNYWPNGRLKCGMIKSDCLHLSLSIPYLLRLTLFYYTKPRKWLLKLTFLVAHLQERINAP